MPVKNASIAFATFLVLTVCAPALAVADAPIGYNNWTGLYAGLELGGGFGQSSRSFAPQGGGSTGDFDVDGVLGGVTAGYNYQLYRSPVVFGIEGDFSGSSVGGSPSCPEAGRTCEGDMQWLATFRPRIGYAFDRIMPYATAGLAVGSVHNHSYIDATGTTTDESSSTQYGFAAGAGVEAAIYGNWSVKAEYLYVDLNDAHPPSSIGVPTNMPFNENIARVGLNYKFN